MASKESSRAMFAAEDAKVNKAKKDKKALDYVNYDTAATPLSTITAPFETTDAMLQQLIRAGGQSPLGLTVGGVDSLLGQFKKSLLGKKTEAELDAKGKSLLQQGSDIANRLTARINTAAQAANSPGAAAQTRRSQSLLG